MAFITSSYIVLHLVSQEFRMVEDLNLKELMIWLIRALFLIIVIYVAFQVLKAILGGTWATENIIIAGIGIILSGMFVLAGFLINQGNILGRLEERTKNIGDSLSNLGKDFKRHLLEP